MNCSKCEKFKELSFNYVEGTLEDWKKQFVENHAKECEECSSELETVKGMLACCKTLSDVLPPEGFTDRVIERVRAIRKTEKNYAKRRPRWHDWRVYSPIAACILIALLFKADVFKTFERMKSDNYIGSSVPPVISVEPEQKEPAQSTSEPAVQESDAQIAQADDAAASPVTSATPKASALPSATPAPRRAESVAVLQTPSASPAAEPGDGSTSEARKEEPAQNGTEEIQLFKAAEEEKSESLTAPQQKIATSDTAPEESTAGGGGGSLNKMPAEKKTMKSVTKYYNISGAVDEKLKAELESAKNAEELEAILKNNNIGYETETIVDDYTEAYEDLESRKNEILNEGVKSSPELDEINSELSEIEKRCKTEQIRIHYRN